MIKYAKINLFLLSWIVFITNSKAQAPLIVNSNTTLSVNSSYTSITVNNGYTLTLNSSITVNCTGIIVQGGKIVIQNAAKLISSGEINFNQPSTAIKGGIEISGTGTQLLATNINFGYFSSLQASYITVSNSALNITGSLNMGTNSQLTLSSGAQFISNNGNLNMNDGAKVTVSNSSFSIRNVNQNNSNCEISLNQATFTALETTNINGVLKLENNSLLSQVGTMNINSPGTVDCRTGSSLELKADLNNSSNLNAYPSGSEPYFIFSSTGHQIVNGFNKFYKVKLSGANAQKEFVSATEVTFNLDLGNAELYTAFSVFYLSNPDVNALVRTTGFISSEEWSADFKRATASTENYLFPLGSKGSSANYRPIVITPKSANAGNYSAHLVYHAAADPNLSVYDPNTIIAAVNSVNKKPLNNLYFHKVKRTSGSPDIDLSIFYDPSVDGSFTTLAQPQANPYRWTDNSNGTTIGINGSLFGTLVENKYNGIKYPSYGLFLREEFVLANNNEALIPTPYALLKRKMDGGVFWASPTTLNFKFEEEYVVNSGTPLNFKVFNASRSQQTIAIPTVQNGINWYSLNISTLANGTYSLEVTNSKNERWFLRFNK